ncbi:MAG: shikimate kinase [Bacteroidota bacterium]
MVLNRKIFLVGLPGAGKTTLGMELAVYLGLRFVDLDQEIEKNTKQKIRSIFQEKGESYFRQLEYVHLRRVIDEIPEFVLATGGGTPCFFDNMHLMKNEGTTVFISTPIQLIKQRLQQDSIRPLMQTNSLEHLLKERKKWYQQAHCTISSLKELLGTKNSNRK